jgi:hypothetical protein
VADPCFWQDLAGLVTVKLQARHWGLDTFTTAERGIASTSHIHIYK